MKNTIVILLDAFRHDYITKEYTPFLYSLSRSSKYYRKLTPGFGFCERTEILVGLEASESNMFTAIGYDPENSPYRKYAWLLKGLHWIEKNLSSRLISKVLRRAIWEVVSNSTYGFHPVNIPLNELQYFSLTEDGVLSKIQNDERSIKNICKNNNICFNDRSSTYLNQKISGTDSDRIELLEKYKKIGFHLLYISSADSNGHKYGPEAFRCSKEISVLDAQLKDFYFKMGDINNNWFFVGDHGMTSVKEKIDILKEFEGKMGAHYKRGLDYLFFIDSTVFRFWSNISCNASRNECIQKAQDILSSVCSFVGTPEDFGLVDGRTYGDLIASLESGKMFFPDYFNVSNKEIKGMHGYMPDNDNSTRGMAIVLSSDAVTTIVEDGSLSDIYLDIKASII